MDISKIFVHHRHWNKTVRCTLCDIVVHKSLEKEHLKEKHGMHFVDYHPIRMELSSIIIHYYLGTSEEKDFWKNIGLIESLDEDEGNALYELITDLPSKGKEFDEDISSILAELQEIMEAE